MRRPAAALLLLPFLLLACGDDGDDPAVEASDEAAPSTTGAAADDYRGPSEASGGGAAAGDGAQVTASGFRFDPAELTLPAGEATISLSNEDDADHTFTIADLDVDVAMPGGETTEASVTLPESGTFEWVCRIHASMRGTLTVG